LGCIASSFNTYYKDYLIGKELYSFWIEKHKVMKREAYKEKLMKEEGGEIERENAVFIEDQSKQYLEIINNFGEFSVFKAWLLSFPAVITKSYGWNDTLSKVRMIQQKAKEDLDLFSFYKKLALVTDAINSMP
jgi:membrane protein YqaA with SNARE-associated domain